MNEQEYREWMALHIRATGAEPNRLSEVLATNRETICERWHASYVEMCECTERLIERGRVPAFPDGHTNVLKVELDGLRSEANRLKNQRNMRAIYGGHVAGCDCPSCNGGEILPAWESARARLEAAVKDMKKKRKRKK